MKLMEVDLMLSVINLWLINHLITYTEFFNHLQTYCLLPPKLKETKPQDKCAKEEVFWGKQGEVVFCFFFLFLCGLVCWGIFIGLFCCCCLVCLSFCGFLWFVLFFVRFFWGGVVCLFLLVFSQYDCELKRNSVIFKTNRTYFDIN